MGRNCGVRIAVGLLTKWDYSTDTASLYLCLFHNVTLSNNSTDLHIGM